jgi:hypothetical protein
LVFGSLRSAASSVGERLHETTLFVAGGLEAGEDGADVGFVGGGIVAGQQDGAAGQSGFDGVERRLGLAFRRSGPVESWAFF